MSNQTKPVHNWPGLDPARLPQHVAVIMDGNGRWAKKRLLPKNAGHAAGVDSLKEMVKHCRELGIRTLTAYAFSTENWSRPKEEVNYLMNLFLEVIEREVDELLENGVRLRFLGDIPALSDSLQAIIRRAEARTERNDALTLNIALNYGGRREIIQAVQALLDEGAKEVDDKTFADHLYTHGQPDPDLLIRTSGELRLSNYLLWQLAYTEIFVTETLWPDFRQTDFLKALLDFQGRNRRFGGRP